MSYCVTGITTFSNKISYFKLILNESLIIRILAIAFPIGIIIMIVIYIASFSKKELEGKEWFRNMYILLVFSVATTAVIVPIADEIHFIIGAMITIISIIYLLYVLLKNSCQKQKKLMKFIQMYAKSLSKILLVVAICNSMYVFILYNINSEKRTDVKHFKNIIIEDYLYNRIVEIDEFILDQEENGKEVYILDISACIINIPLDKYYKNYDMFNLGNFGSGGTDRNNK